MDPSAQMVQALQAAPTDIADPNLQWRDPVPAISAMVKSLYGGLEDTAKNSIQSAGHYAKTGEYDPKPVVDATLMAAGGASPFAEAGAAGIFGGRMAKTSDLRALGEAKRMQGNMVDRGTIWRDTGWWQGPDGAWRFEIPDAGAKLVDIEKSSRLLSPDSHHAVPVGPHEYLPHPELFDAYPHLKDVVMHTDVPPGTLGISEWGSIGMNRNYMKDKTEFRNTLLHELQHEIQRPEGFMVGSGPIDTRTLNNYGIPEQHQGPLSNMSRGSPTWNQFSEVEARNVERRSNFDKKASRAIPPWITQDVAPSAVELESPYDKFQYLLKALKGEK